MGFTSFGTLCAFFITVIAIPTGIYAAAKRGKTGDFAVISATQLGIAIPNFWFAIILVGIFAIKLQWFSAGGFSGWKDGLFNGITSLTLPAIALALPQAAILSRVMRSALIETLGEDYIRTARAKGLSSSQTIWTHALRNALIPVLTIIGLQFSFLLAGAIIIEQVFYLPGLGVSFSSNNPKRLNRCRKCCYASCFCSDTGQFYRGYHLHVSRPKVTTGQYMIRPSTSLQFGILLCLIPMIMATISFFGSHSMSPN